MSIAHISLAQALSVWSDLEAAYHGVNGYGGDTAEIYVHRLRSGVHLSLTEISGDVVLANTALLDLLVLFQEAHPDAEIWFDATRRSNGTLLQKGYNADCWPLEQEHRHHIRILRSNQDVDDVLVELVELATEDQMAEAYRRAGRDMKKDADKTRAILLGAVAQFERNAHGLPASPDPSGSTREPMGPEDFPGEDYPNDAPER